MKKSLLALIGIALVAAVSFAAQAAGYDGIIAKRADRYYDNEAREFATFARQPRRLWIRVVGDEAGKVQAAALAARAAISSRDSAMAQAPSLARTVRRSIRLSWACSGVRGTTRCT